MIIFLEGLPGHGKSLAAIKDYLVPAVQKGRKVFAYVEGLDYQKLSEVAGVTLEKVEQLLVHIEREQVPTIYDHVENDSLVIIDELQNFWPKGRHKLDAKITQFVAEHRHRGLDIVCMGQVRRDCHDLWLGRVDTLVQFVKRDSIGQANSYNWKVLKPVGAGKFKEATNGKADYDKKYFGCYASHTSDTTNTDTFNDARANIKNGKVYKFAMRFIWVIVAAIIYILYLFFGGGLEKSLSAKKPEKPASVETRTVHTEPAPAPKASQTPPAQPETLKVPEVPDFVADLSKLYRVRLTGVVQGQKRVIGLVEWRDPSNRVVDRLTLEQLNGLGWYVMLSPSGDMVQISKPGKVLIATQWPTVDDRETMPAKVPDATQDTIRGGPSAHVLTVAQAPAKK